MSSKLLEIALFCVLVVFSEGLLAQCQIYKPVAKERLHPNEIRTSVGTRGNLFNWESSEDAFVVPFQGDQSRSALGAGGIWIGGYDEDGGLRVAVETFGIGLRQDYLSGPLMTDDKPFTRNCADWDKVWTVNRHHILQHLQDFEEDGIIDQPIASVFGWPGSGNAFFDGINGFALPAGDFAPFWDKNANGLYEPEAGDYPLPNGVDPRAIPDQMTWTVVNDLRIHTASQGDPLRVEIRQTQYGYSCEENTILNRTLFTDFEVISRNPGVLDSVYFAMWLNPRLDCWQDDRIGSVPSEDAAFIYNHDALPDVSDTLCGGPPWYTSQQGPGVFSISYLDRQMSSCMYYLTYNDGQWPNAMSPPQSGAPLEFYRFITGSWRDGAPITIGGTGYDPGSAEPITSFVFPGNPLDSSVWAMSNVDGPNANFALLVSTRIGQLVPDQRVRFTAAMALHLDDAISHADNIELMYAELPVLKEHYASGFTGCLKSLTPCLDTCVWPGDANHDGIVSHLDFLQVGLGMNASGPVRSGPLSWAPHASDDWGLSIAGVDAKHADLDGNGIIGDDVDILKVHYNLTHDHYLPDLSCPEGDELRVEGGFTKLYPTTADTYTEVWLNAGALDSLFGLAYTIHYDTTYFVQPLSEVLRSPFEGLSFIHFSPGNIDIASFHADGNKHLDADVALAAFRLEVKERLLEPGIYDTTELCIRNVRGVLKDGTEVFIGSNTIQYIFLVEGGTSVLDESFADLAIYPNPSSGIVHINCPEKLIGSMYRVVNLTGQVVLDGVLHDPEVTLPLEDGMYTVVVWCDDSQAISRIVVLK